MRSRLRKAYVAAASRIMHILELRGAIVRQGCAGKDDGGPHVRGRDRLPTAQGLRRG